MQMADVPERYMLQPVRSPREWAAYHAIRRDAIFTALLPGQAYDEHDPDEFASGHLPSSASAAISSGEATAAFCSGLRAPITHAIAIGEIERQRRRRRALMTISVRRNFDAKCLRRIEVDNQLKFGRLQHSSSAGFVPLRILPV
jgi:hypothetical protein